MRQPRRSFAYRHLVRRAPAFALALLLALPVASPLRADHSYDFDARVTTVTALMDAGRRLDPAHAGDRALETVAAVMRTAEVARAAGREEEAYQRLDQAYVLVKMIVRKLAAEPATVTSLVVPARSERPVDAARQSRYDALAASVDALGEAHRAVREELGSPDTGIDKAVSGLVQSATSDRTAGRLDVAMRKMKSAYALLQGEIVRLRGGQTLVRELSFDSDLQEYEYEVDRHDTHLMLVALLLESSTVDTERQAEVRGAVDRSMRLQWVARTHAAAGDYATAVAWMEQASDALVALIRSQGHDIP